MNKIILVSLGLALSSGLLGCNTTPVQDGAVLGGALGAGLGAIAGHQSGHQGEGALIGAAAGALTGALIGDAVSQPQPAPVVVQQPAPVYHDRTAHPAHARGHYETRLVTTPSGACYERRVWVPGY